MTDRPTPPGSLSDPAGATSHFSAEMDLPRGFGQRVAGICPAVTDPAALAESGRDWWPIGVAWVLDNSAPALAGVLARPTSTEQVAELLRLCSAERVPLTPRAGRSGVCGGAVPVHGGVSLDLSDMAGIVAVDNRDLLVDVLPGTWGDEFERDLQAEHGLTVGHWPQSMEISTVGGWVACRGAGQYSTRYGKIEDLTAALQVVLSDGRIIRVGQRSPRSSTGPDLRGLFLGSEGTLGVITGVTLTARPVPEGSLKQAWSFPTMRAGLEACRLILRLGARPAVLRLYDSVETTRHFPGTPGCALVIMDEDHPALIDGTAAVIDTVCTSAYADDGATRLDDHLVDHWYETRNKVASLESLYGAGLVADTIEIAAPWSGLEHIYASVLREVGGLRDTIAVSAHQSHAYTSGACLYFSFAGRPAEDWDGYYRAVWDLVMNATTAHGGSLSHHHGVGLNRYRHLAAADPTQGLLAGIKQQLDPAGILNPGKLGLPDPFPGSDALGAWLR